MVLNLFNRKRKTDSSVPLFDEAFLRRLERLTFRTAPSLRGAILGERRSRNLRPALDFSDHRPYASGDDLRHVDWNAYARHEELFVKLGEATQSVNVHILLDRSRSMAWEAGQKPKAAVTSSNKWIAACRLAGAMGYLALAGGERLQVTPFAQGLDESFGPTRGKRQAVALLQYLAAVSPASRPAAGKRSDLDLAHCLAGYARSQPQGGLLVLISDLFDTTAPSLEAASDGEPEQGRWGLNLSEGLRHLPPPRWQVLVMHVLSEPEMRPTLEGDFDLQDVETGERLPFYLAGPTLAQYRLRVRRWCAELQSACAGRGAAYTRLLAEWSMEQAVIPYLRRHGVIQ